MFNKGKARERFRLDAAGRLKYKGKANRVKPSLNIFQKEEGYGEAYFERFCVCGGVAHAFLGRFHGAGSDS
jgi:hypothetical protein